MAGPGKRGRLAVENSLEVADHEAFVLRVLMGITKGKTHTDIAATEGCTRKTIYNTLARYSAEVPAGELVPAERLILLAKLEAWEVEWQRALIPEPKAVTEDDPNPAPPRPNKTAQEMLLSINAVRRALLGMDAPKNQVIHFEGDVQHDVGPGVLDHLEQYMKLADRTAGTGVGSGRNEIDQAAAAEREDIVDADIVEDDPVPE